MSAATAPATAPASNNTGSEQTRLHTEYTTLDVFDKLVKACIANIMLSAVILLDIDLTLIDGQKIIYPGLLKAFQSLKQYANIKFIFVTSRGGGWSPSAHNPREIPVSRFEDAVRLTLLDIKSFLDILGVSTEQEFTCTQCEFEKIFEAEVDEDTKELNSVWKLENFQLVFASKYKGDAIRVALEELGIKQSELVIVLDDNPVLGHLSRSFRLHRR